MPRYLARPTLEKEDERGTTTERKAEMAETTAAQHAVHNGATAHFLGLQAEANKAARSPKHWLKPGSLSQTG